MSFIRTSYLLTDFKMDTKNRDILVSVIGKIKVRTDRVPTCISPTGYCKSVSLLWVLNHPQSKFLIKNLGWYMVNDKIHDYYFVTYSFSFREREYHECKICPSVCRPFSYLSMIHGLSLFTVLFVFYSLLSGTSFSNENSLTLLMIRTD